MDPIAVPLVAVICSAAIFATFMAINSRNRSEVQRTIRIALERGAPLTPELMSQLGTRKRSGHCDMRRGIITLSVGLACLAAGFVSDSLEDFATIGVFPILMGLGFLLVWKLDGKKQVA